MSRLETDLSILRKFDFEHAPVGVKFLFSRPEEIEPLDKPAAFCDMIRIAQERGTPFYFSRGEEDCFGRVVLGMEEAPLFAEAGLLGERFGVYEEPRANERIYQHVPRLVKGTVNYAAFSVLDALTFEPDLLILMATPSQAEIVLRAMSYSTGELWESKKTPVLSCAWIYAYPWLTGKVNYMITGMGFGSKARHALPEGWILISIPWDKIPPIIKSLEKMTWILPAYTEGREVFLEREARVREEGRQEVEREARAEALSGTAADASPRA
jgi:uncharacterized protein (DUF169 family)